MLTCQQRDRDDRDAAARVLLAFIPDRFSTWTRTIMSIGGIAVFAIGAMVDAVDHHNREHHKKARRQGDAAVTAAVAAATRTPERTRKHERPNAPNGTDAIIGCAMQEVGSVDLFSLPGG